MESNQKNKRVSLYLTEDKYRMLLGIQNERDSLNKNAVILEALEFYYGYLTGSISQDYLCGTLGTKLEAVQNRSNDQLARLLYRQSVEINMLVRLLASDKKMSKDEYEKVCRKAVQDVNSTRGIINLYEAGLDDGNRKE
ncbi:hypothetical protein [Scatolibacter rhodanostii]|uniref:hypothetical protein n=1 Tax=Scatolibacter rhodanostii TaxID=2014781 RepID=UPI000C082898|nr:hypothetical protein [Scatolibacter rhodanostii]